MHTSHAATMETRIHAWRLDVDASQADLVRFARHLARRMDALGSSAPRSLRDSHDLVIWQLRAARCSAPTADGGRVVSLDAVRRARTEVRRSS